MMKIMIMKNNNKLMKILDMKVKNLMSSMVQRAWIIKIKNKKLVEVDNLLQVRK